MTKPGETLTTTAHLDAAPRGTVMRSRTGSLAETGDINGEPCVWDEGWSSHADAMNYSGPFAVLYVPTEDT